MLSLLLSGLFLFSSMSAENLRSNNNLIAMSVILSILVSTKRDQDFLKEWLIPDLEQKIYKMILAYFSCPKARKLKSNSLGKLNYSRNNIGEGNGTPLQYSCLEDPMDGGAWWAAVHGVAKSRTRLSDFTFTFHFHALEKEMVTHPSILAWRIPGTGEPDWLPSMGLHSRTQLKQLSSSSSNI